MDKAFLLLCCLIGSTGSLVAQVDSLKADSLLLLQIENQFAANDPPVSPPPQPIASSNPGISVIGDFEGLYKSYGIRHFDAVLNEVEFSFESVIDPYAQAKFFYSVGEDPLTGEFKSEIEEGYLTTLTLPGHLQLKAGRFKQDLGRINPVHSHALPFIDMPDAFVAYFGEEGLKGDGLSLSWLVPNPAFYQELTFETTRVSDNPSFGGGPQNRFLILGHLKNFWELSPDATMELGITGINGRNLRGGKTNLLALDLTYKWKPVQFNTYKSLTFQNEIYFSHAVTDSTILNSLGWYSMLSYQLGKRLFMTARYDHTNSPYSPDFIQQSGSLTIGWYATEFQKIELGGKYTSTNAATEEFGGEQDYAQTFLRWIFVIGSHGAHTY